MRFGTRLPVRVRYRRTGTSDAPGTACLHTPGSGTTRLPAECAAGATVNDKPASMILDLRVQPGGAAAADQLIEFGRARGVTVVVKEFK